MGLRDLFKKKKPESTFPENELEKSFMEAATNPAAQSEFYQKLLWNQLFVITTEHSNKEPETKILEENTTVQFVAFDGGVIPVFTSHNRIFDKGIMKEQVPVLGMKGQDLFACSMGASFVLNPYSDYAKELNPSEIEDLMNGTIFDQIEKDALEQTKMEEFNKLYEQATSKQSGLIFLEGYRISGLSDPNKAKLEESIQYFQQCLDLFPDHWPSMFLMGKSLQRLERHVEALAQMERANEIEPGNHTIAMEAALEAMHLKDFDKALYYSAESIKRKPDDFALMGNHAMNLLIIEKDSDALEVITQAIKLQPNDQVNWNIESLIRDVISGVRTRPTFEDTIR